MIKGHTKECRKSWETISGGFYCPIHKSFIDREEDFADDQRKIWKNEGMTCLYCEHLKDLLDSNCKAFPSQIPCPFLTGMKIHKRPTRFQKNSIVYEPRLSCPFCQSKKTVPIIWGYPTKKTLERWQRGEIQLGGCEKSEHDFNRFCKDCQRQFFAGKRIIKKEKK